MIDSVFIKSIHANLHHLERGHKIFFNPNLNILFGQNNCGKSTVIQLLAAYSSINTIASYQGWSSSPLKIRFSDEKIFPDAFKELAPKNCEAIIEWDGSPTFYYNTVSADKSDGLNFDGQNETKSAGSIRHDKINRILRLLKNPPPTFITGENVAKNFDEYFKSLVSKNRSTVIWDDPDRDYDAQMQLEFWDETLPKLAEKYQVIVATNSVMPIWLGYPVLDLSFEGEYHTDGKKSFVGHILESIKQLQVKFIGAKKLGNQIKDVNEKKLLENYTNNPAREEILAGLLKLIDNTWKMSGTPLKALPGVDFALFKNKQVQITGKWIDRAYLVKDIKLSGGVVKLCPQCGKELPQSGTVSESSITYCGTPCYQQSKSNFLKVGDRVIFGDKESIVAEIQNQTFRFYGENLWHGMFNATKVQGNIPVSSTHYNNNMNSEITVTGKIQSFNGEYKIITSADSSQRVIGVENIYMSEFIGKDVKITGKKCLPNIIWAKSIYSQKEEEFTVSGIMAVDENGKYNLLANDQYTTKYKLIPLNEIDFQQWIRQEVTIDGLKGFSSTDLLVKSIRKKIKNQISIREYNLHQAKENDFIGIVQKVEEDEFILKCKEEEYVLLLAGNLDLNSLNGKKVYLLGKKFGHVIWVKEVNDWNQVNIYEVRYNNQTIGKISGSHNTIATEAITYLKEQALKQDHPLYGHEIDESLIVYSLIQKGKIVPKSPMDEYNELEVEEKTFKGRVVKGNDGGYDFVDEQYSKFPIQMIHPEGAEILNDFLSQKMEIKGKVLDTGILIRKIKRLKESVFEIFYQNELVGEITSTNEQAFNDALNYVKTQRSIEINPAQISYVKKQVLAQ